jgi:hypothetical protein
LRTHPPQLYVLSPDEMEDVEVEVELPPDDPSPRTGKYQAHKFYPVPYFEKPASSPKGKAPATEDKSLVLEDRTDDYKGSTVSIARCAVDI